MLEYYPCSNGIRILYQPVRCVFLIHEFLNRFAWFSLVDFGGPQMYGRTHLPFRKVMGLWLPNLWVTPNGFKLPLPNIKCMKKWWSKFKITNVCFIKTAGSSPRLQICSLLYIFGNKKPPQMVQSAGSKYWLPGFGGLIRGQIYNPEVRWFFRCFVLLASSRTGWRPFCKGQKPCKSFWCSGPIWTRRAADKFLDQTQMLHGTGIFADMNT